MYLRRSGGGGLCGSGGGGGGDGGARMIYGCVICGGAVLQKSPRRAEEADRRLARMINNVSVKLRAAIEEYQLFTQELEASPGWVVNKDRSIESTLQEILVRETKDGSIGYSLDREVVRGLKKMAIDLKSEGECAL
ncbi:hypothetical protein Tco_0195957 [Tanacetum coccineum]